VASPPPKPPVSDEEREEQRKQRREELVDRKKEKFARLKELMEAAEAKGEELPPKAKKAFQKLEAFEEMLELNGGVLPSPTPKNVVRRKENKRGQQCCQALGWGASNTNRFPFVCGAASNAAAGWRCEAEATFEEAKTTCKREGGRLCRNNAVTAADQGAECQAKDAWTWTTKKCGENEEGREQRPASGGDGRCVMDLESKAAVRCCSNVCEEE